MIRQIDIPIHKPGTEHIWKILESVVDPEIPVLTVLDMGIVRDVTTSDSGVEVSITPTYSGCPAMDVISTEIKSALERNHISNVKIKTVLSPAWTTDWLTEAGKEKLRRYGIAPASRPTQAATMSTMASSAPTS